MGDFERTFGAGADAVDIIDRYAHQEAREARRSISKTEGRIFFGTYADAVAWENANQGVPFIRRRKGEGFEVELVK